MTLSLLGFIQVVDTQIRDLQQENEAQPEYHVVLAQPRSQVWSGLQETKRTCKISEELFSKVGYKSSKEKPTLIHETTVKKSAMRERKRTQSKCESIKSLKKTTDYLF